MLRVARPLAACFVIVSSGCSIISPEPPDYQSIDVIRDELDLASDHAAPMPDHVEAQHRILFYLPNRLLDVLDLVKVNVGVGPGFGLEVYVSENIWISYLNFRSWRLGLDGRSAGVFEEGRYREWHLGDRRSEQDAAGRRPLWTLGPMRPFEAPLRPGVPAVPEVPKNAWDIGAQAHVLLAGIQALVRPFEIFDLLVGLWGDDPAEDDYGVRDYPLHAYAPQSQIVEIFINAVDRMNDADLRATLSKDLRKRSLLRRGNQLVTLGEAADSPPAAGFAVGDRGQDYLIIGDVTLEPARYRGPDGALDFSVRCTGARLRFGVPAQFEYALTFFNRFLQSTQEYELILRVEDRHWVITRLREVDRVGR